MTSIRHYMDIVESAGRESVFARSGMCYLCNLVHRHASPDRQEDARGPKARQ